jgi:mRNA interferase MazF
MTHCRFPTDVALMVPMTTRHRGLRHHVRIDSPESGLRQPSWARTDDITAVSTARFTQRTPIGTASDEEVEQLSSWLCDMVAFCG